MDFMADVAVKGEEELCNQPVKRNQEERGLPDH